MEERKADLICLQEIDHFEDVYKPALNGLGYFCETAYRRGQDAVLIGYCMKRFKLIDKTEVNYNDLFEKYDYNRDFKRHNVGLIVLL